MHNHYILLVLDATWKAESYKLLMAPPSWWKVGVDYIKCKTT